MSSIDQRVVEMTFDNHQFQRGIQDTLKSLDSLKKGLVLDPAIKGMSNAALVGRDLDLNLGGVAESVGHIASKFTALGAIGFTVLQNLTTTAIRFASRVGNLVFDPLVAGGKKRAQNIEQAKFQFRGLGMDIQDTMDSALGAEVGTAYGLDEAARAAGQFGASGMRAGDDMTTALRAISGVAAMTNSTYTDTAHIFTKVAGNGRVMGDDLLRMSSRGLNAAATLADSMGVTEAAVREMVTEGKVDFKTFYEAMDEAFGENSTKANETYAGSLSNLEAAFSRIGAKFFTPYLTIMRDLFNDLTPAVDAAGKALEPVIDLMLFFTRRIGKGIGDFAQDLDFSNAMAVVKPLTRIVKDLYYAFVQIAGIVGSAFRDIFPPASIVQIYNFLRGIERFTNSLKMGEEQASKLGRVFRGVFAIFSIGWSILKEVGRFLADIFDQVFEGSGAFIDGAANVGDFLVALDEAVKKGDGIRKFFEGLSSVLEGPIDLIQELGRGIANIFNFNAPDSDRMAQALEPLGRLGAIALDTWDRAVESFKRVAAVFKPFTDALNELLGGAGEGLYELFKDADLDQVLETLNTFLFGGIFLMIHRFAENLSNSFGSIQYNLTQPFRQVTFALTTMQNTLRAMTLTQIAIAVALLAASVVALSRVDEAGLKKSLGALTIMLGQLVASLAGLTFVGGPQGIVAIGAGLILFSIAIRILVSSVKALAEIDTEDLVKGLTGVVTLIGGLIVAVQGMSGHTANMIQAGAGLLLLAFGIKVLADATTDLAGLSWEEMRRGLVGVGSLLGALVIFTQLAKVNGAGVAQGVGILLLAAAIKILASAAQDFAALSWEEVGKGLASISGILAAVAAFTRGVGDPAKVMAAGASLVLIGAAMKILASAMGDFAKFSWEEIGKGLVSMGLALAGITLALNLIPPTTVASAASVAIVAGALTLIAQAMATVGSMDWGELAGAVMGLGAMLGIIVIAMNAMTTALPGAAATLLVAGALWILAPVLERLGAMSLGEIGKGLLALAGIFAVIGLAGLVLAPVVPVLSALAGAVALLGLGLLGIGAGTLMFAAGLTAIAGAGLAAVGVLKAFIEMIFNLLPVIAEQVGLALVALAVVIGEAGPELMSAFGDILEAFLEMIVDQTPNLVDTLIVLLDELIRAVTEMVPTIATAMYQWMLAMLEKMEEYGPSVIAALTTLVVALIDEVTEGIEPMATAVTALIVAFLEEIEDNLEDVLTAGADLIIEFIEGMGKQSLRITEAALAAILTFIEGLTKAIENNMDKIHDAGKDLAFAIADGMTLGLSSKIPEIGREAAAMARGALTAAGEAIGVSSPSKEFKKIGEFAGEGFAIGLAGSSKSVEESWTLMTDLLTKATKASANEVEKLEKQLVRLKGAKKQDNEAIKETTDSLAQARKEYTLTSNATQTLNKDMEANRVTLGNLSNDYDGYTERLDKAEKKLDDLVQTRRSYRDAIQGQYEDLPNIGEETGLHEFIRELENANTDLDNFKLVMQKLRDQGLSDQLYEEFMTKGTDILPFLNELLAGGEESVEVVNNLSRELEFSATQLGLKAARELHQAGVDAAQGLVDGLKSKTSALEEEMAAIAKIITDALKKELQIKSPSRIMQKLGEQTISGLSSGMQKAAPAVSKAAEGVGKDAYHAMKKSISGMADLLAMDTDLNPTITPVLDLTAFHRDAGQIASTLSGQSIDIDSAHLKAKDASTGYQTNNEALRATTTADDISAPAAVTYNQYNQSPRALSSAEIYRQTKNQLSVTKGALTPNAT